MRKGSNHPFPISMNFKWKKKFFNFWKKKFFGNQISVTDMTFPISMSTFPISMNSDWLFQYQCELFQYQWNFMCNFQKFRWKNLEKNWKKKFTPTSKSKIFWRNDRIAIIFFSRDAPWWKLFVKNFLSRNEWNSAS